MRELFGQPYDDLDPYRVVKGYFDRMYVDGNFIEAANYILNRVGFSTDGAYCDFLEKEDGLEEGGVNGVEFAYGYPPKDEDVVVVSEKVCFKYVALCCEKYLSYHPESSEEIKKIMANIPAN